MFNAITLYRFRLSRLAIAAWVVCCVSARAQQELRITEFMASNTSGVEDNFGQKSDWIEITNTGTTQVNLLGWRLSDNSLDPTKWIFPAVTLNSGSRMLVWASTRDRRDPGQPLHTNFNLRAAGDYLGLFRPDGALEHDFGSQFPPQTANVSYGIFSGTAESILISPSSGGTAGSGVKYRVPADDSLLNSWFLPSTSESGWTDAHNGLGYDTNTAGFDYNPLLSATGNIRTLMSGLRTSFYIRIHFNVANPAIVSQLKLRLKYDDGYAAWLNGVYVNRDSVNVPSGQNPPFSYTVAGVNRSDALAVVYTEQNVSTGLLQPGDNVLALQGFNQTAGSSDLLLLAELAATVPSPPGNGYFSTPTPNAANAGGTLNPGPLITEVPETVPQPDTGSAGINLVASSASSSSGVQGQNGWSYGYMIGTGNYDPNASFTSFAGGAGQGAWNGTSQTWNGSGWTLANGGAPWTQIYPTSLHPNGTNSGTLNSTIVRWVSNFNGPGTIKGNFHCPAPCGDGVNGVIYKNGAQLFGGTSFQTSVPYELITTFAVGDKIDFLCGPGAANDGCDGTNYLMEIYEGVPTSNTIQLPITAKVQPTLNPVSSVSLKWRIMFGAETTQTMTDNGLNGDAVAGDGIYTAIISTNQLAKGEMIRWRVEARDSANVMGKAPSFLDPIDSPEYYGTVALDAALATSLLPVVHWFMEGNQNPDTNARARVAVFYLNQFYDNVGANIHGQSTQGFGKKSYDLDFTGEQRFKWSTDPNARRAKDVNLLSNWADKAKVRNTMAYEICRLAGVAAHWAQPVRVQRNGQFFSVADMVEDGDDRYLERAGLDPNGALYKLYSPMQTNFSAEKKSRREEGTADLLALATGLAQSGDAYERFCYDNVDTPATVNYCAAFTMTSNTDSGHKNYYCYRDSNDSLLWRLLPWDLDLSFGRNWTANASGNPEGLPVNAYYFDDTIYSRNPVDIGGGNTFFRWGYYGDARTTEMYRRRLRTLADTFLKQSGTDSWHHTRTNELNALIDPPTVVSDADLDLQRWGSWGNNDTMPTAIGRILSSNPGANVNYSLPYIQGRRNHLYNTIFTQGGWPGSQPAHMPIIISAVVYNPGTPNSQNQEYIELNNLNSIAVDVSNWKLQGAIDFTLPPGTVLPSFNSAQPDRSKLYVARNVRGFINRTVSPRGNEKRLVVGGYPGQLSARGETLTLVDDTNFTIATNTYPPAPTPSQNFLRVSQILFAPAQPTAAELMTNPALVASDFEWLELVNTGTTTLVLDQARFTEGIDYTFPNGVGVSLAAGAKLILAANPAAFAMRYPGVTVPVYGPYIGQLDNDGEQLHLVDTMGESVLEFSYNDAWYSPTNRDGYALVILNAAGTPHSDYGSRVRWGLSSTVGGQPGATAPTLGMCYDFWTNTPFTSLERDNPAIVGENVDLDFDEVTNWTEYALGSPPKSPSVHHLPTGSTVTVSGQSYTALTFRRQINCVDVDYIVEVSDTLEDDWNSVNTPVGVPIGNGDGTETLTIRDSTPQTQRKFVRLRLERK